MQLDSTFQVLFLHRKQDFSIFCCIPCMEETFVGLIYNKLLDLNEGDLSLHISQTV